MQVEPGVHVLRQSFNLPLPGLDSPIYLNCFVIRLSDGGLLVGVEWWVGSSWWDGVVGY